MKTKIIVLMGIAVCAISLLLISPALANGGDYVLGVYGNANEDDTIDMRDLTYVKLIFFGKKPETELADAKYDGKINPLDFIQIKLIIVGKEKELTVVDSADRIVTVKMPVKRIIALMGYNLGAVAMLGKIDNIVGISTYSKEEASHGFFPELQDRPSVGNYWTGFDYERLVEIALNNTDVIVPGIIVISYVSKVSTVEENLRHFEDITVIGLDFYKGETINDELLKLGYLLEREEKAKSIIDWYVEKEEAVISAVSGLEKPKVYIEWGSQLPGATEFMTARKGTLFNELCEKAGGDNIAKKLVGTVYPDYPKVTWEWVVRENPDIILKEKSSPVYPLGWVDASEAEKIRNEVMSRPGAEEITAVKNGKAYVYHSKIRGASQRVVALTYWAKIFHPEVNLDPKAVQREYLELLGLEYQEDRILVYPEV